ncbi:MAG TPA: glycosyltransferase family 4 protein [Candidatus Krumholzibacteria bacterium]|nr:glycosyltransferase family 4 protein [Candidatus Krumholzibacteria bacterium]
MRVLYIHQYFCTRQGRSGTRSYEFSKHLIARGHHVTMITSTAQLPHLRAAAGKRLSRFSADGIDVIAVDVDYAQSMGPLQRIRSFLRFMCLATWIACRERRHDVVVATSTPLTVGVPGMIASWVRRMPLVFEVRDLWPEAPIQLGFIRHRMLIAFLRWFECLVYRRSTRIVALSPGMRDGVLATGVAAGKIDTIPNCSDLDRFTPGPVDKRAVPELDLAGAFVVTHAGSMGLANGLDILLDAAAEAQRAGWTDVRFLVLGEGAEAVNLRVRAAARGLDNVVFAGSVPSAQVGRYLQASDVCLVLFHAVPVLGTNSPNKLFDALAAGRPIIVNTAGWMRELVQQQGCGLAAEPGSGESLARQIGVLRQDAELRGIMGSKARLLAEREFDRAILAQRFERSLVIAAGLAEAPARVCGVQGEPAPARPSPATTETIDAARE